MIMLVACATAAAASVVWACVPQPLVTVQPRSTGSAGSEVTVRAIALTGGRAEIRWNTIDGELLASGGGHELTQPITIPRVPPGLYSILLIERDPAGAVAATGRASFLVTDDDQGGKSRSMTTALATDGNRSQPESRTPSTRGNAALMLGGGGLFVLGALGGRVVSRRRRTASDLPGRPRE